LNQSSDAPGQGHENTARAVDEEEARLRDSNASIGRGNGCEWVCAKQAAEKPLFVGSNREPYIAVFAERMSDPNDVPASGAVTELEPYC